MRKVFRVFELREVVLMDIWDTQEIHPHSLHFWQEFATFELAEQYVNSLALNENVVKDGTEFTILPTYTTAK